MCEHCKRYQKWGTPLNEEELDGEEGPCEWIGEETEGFATCEDPVSCIVYDRYVEEHLCEQHVASENADLDAGLGDFLRTFGMQESCDFLPITQEETCEHVDNPLDENWVQCGRRATHAKVVVQPSALCDEHTAAMGYSRG